MQRNSKRNPGLSKSSKSLRSRSRTRSLLDKCFSAFEKLETRSLMSTVTSLADAGPGSLRAAVVQANDEIDNPGPDTIAFDPSVKGGASNPWTVKKIFRASQIAEENHLPTISLVESGGADLPTQKEIFIPGGRLFRDLTRAFRNTTPYVLIEDFTDTPAGRDPLGASVGGFLKAVRGESPRPVVTGEEAARALDLALKIEAAAGI